MADRVLPDVGDWFERGTVPARELASSLGEIGVLGMHLEGYGCAGASATAYGLACLELEAGDSGIRSLVSVQGSLAMFAIHRWGSEEQKQEWLPRMAAGEAIGCFGLTEPDAGSDPGAMRTRARRDGDDWVLHGQKMWITNGSVADVAIVWAQTDEGVRGFVVPTDSAGFSTQEIHRKLSLRASVTSELLLDDVRLPAERDAARGRGLRGPLSCLNEARFGIVWGVWAPRARASRRRSSTAASEWHSVGRSRRRSCSSRSSPGWRSRSIAGHCWRRSWGGSRTAAADARTGEHGQAGERRRGPGGRPGGPPGARRERDHARVPGDPAYEQPGVVITYEGTADVHALVVGGALTGLQAFR